MLGVLCLVSGLFFFWDTVTRWADRKERRTRRIILVNIAFIAMTLWLFNISNSTTSSVCLVLGCLVIAAAHSKAVQAPPRFSQGADSSRNSVLYLILAFGFGMDISAVVAEAVGKDPTLTDRTKIWSFLSACTPIRSLAPDTRASGWALDSNCSGRMPALGRINEAHNGYLEVYLNLGIVGLFLLGWFLIASYRTICRRLESFSSLGSLSLAYVDRSCSSRCHRGGLPKWFDVDHVLAGSDKCPRTCVRSRHSFSTLPVRHAGTKEAPPSLVVVAAPEG